MTRCHRHPCLNPFCEGHADPDGDDSRAWLVAFSYAVLIVPPLALAGVIVAFMALL